MADLTLTKTRLTAGRYEGVLGGSETPPIVEAVFQDRVVGRATLTPASGRKDLFELAIDLPPEVVSDGVQTVVLRSAADQGVLDRITILAGEPLDEDIRAELALLRDELDLLKRSFRRHCVETDED